MAHLDTTSPFGPRSGLHRSASFAGTEPGAQPESAATSRPGPTDAELARAFRDLEASIGDLKCMSALMHTVAEDTVHQAEGFMGKHLRQRSGLQGYKIHVLTEEQDDALGYALYHLQDLIRELHVRYYKGYEKQAAS